jgi:hypothetical protein
MFPPSVIIRNLHVVSVSVAPHKTNTPLLVDAYAVLPRTVTFQLMKSDTRRHSQIRQTLGRVQQQKLSSRWLSNVHELTNILIVEKPLRVGALEGPYHIQRV